jgi:phosphotransferase system HPr (HPr) family protein
MQITENVKIENRLGLYLRAAAQLVKTSSQFKCWVHVRHQRNSADGKSLLNLIGLGAIYGSELTLVCEGEDARDAQEKLRELFLNKFGEKE